MKRGSYIPKDPATALAMTLGRRYRDSTNQFVDRNVASMALKLGVEEHDLRMVLDDAWRQHFLKTIVSIRARSRDLDRNESLARGYFDTTTVSAIGTGLVPGSNGAWPRSARSGSFPP